MATRPLLGGHPDEVPLTAEERRAIRDLHALAKRWPRSLWLFSGSGSLWIMRCGADGMHVMTNPRDGGVDPAYIADRTPAAIPNDGGDW